MGGTARQAGHTMADRNALTEPDLVGLDWGTSSCRAYLLGREGVILADARAPSGLMAVNAGHPRPDSV
jgi:2-dehydro-3-deoxygalactonokinase